MAESIHFESCPFCGNKDQNRFYILDNERVECDQCGAVGPYRDKINEAIEAWNDRVTEELK